MKGLPPNLGFKAESIHHAFHASINIVFSHSLTKLTHYCIIQCLIGLSLRSFTTLLGWTLHPQLNFQCGLQWFAVHWPKKLEVLVDVRDLKSWLRGKLFWISPYVFFKKLIFYWDFKSKQRKSKRSKTGDTNSLRDSTLQIVSSGHLKMGGGGRPVLNVCRSHTACTVRNRATCLFTQDT